MKLLIKIIWLMTLSNVYVEIAQSAEKETVCFATINSTEEKYTFKKYLSKGLNKDKFKFAELTDFAQKGDKTKDAWFERACQSNIKCDVLIVSGHFGGTFFSMMRKHLELPITTLEKVSCENKCKNILSHPKEVFLFGCNTLAEKEKTTRTPEEYFQVLLDDGREYNEALRSVEIRYSATGSSFKDIMRRVFVDVPHVYGFSSIAPSGENVGPLLKKYMTAIPDYKTHLDKIEAKRKDVMSCKDITKWCSDNSTLAECLKITDFSQCSGTSSVVRNDFRNNICSLIGDATTRETKEDIFLEIAQKGDLEVYLDYLEEFLKGQSGEDLEKVLSDKNVLSELNKLKDKISKNIFKLGFFKILEEAKVISTAEFKQIESEVMKKSIISATRSTVDAFQNYNQDGKLIEVELNDAEVKKILNNEFALGIAGSLSVKNENFYEQLALNYEKIKNQHTSINFHTFKNLANSKKYQSMVINDCKDHLRRKSLHIIFAACLISDRIKDLSIQDLELFQLMTEQYVGRARVKIDGFSIDLSDYAYYPKDLQLKILGSQKFQGALAASLERLMVPEISATKINTLAEASFIRNFQIYHLALVGNEKIFNYFKAKKRKLAENEISFMAASALINYKNLMNKSLPFFKDAETQNKKIRLDNPIQSMQNQLVRFLNDQAYPLEARKTVLNALYNHNLTEGEIEQVSDESLRALL